MGTQYFPPASIILPNVQKNVHSFGLHFYQLVKQIYRVDPPLTIKFYYIFKL